MFEYIFVLQILLQVAASLINGLDIWASVSSDQRGPEGIVDGGSTVEVKK